MFEFGDYLVVAFVELLSGDVLEIICPDHLGIGDNVRSFVKYYQRSLFEPVP